MLEITIPISPEGWDEEQQEFVDPKIQTLQLEHSLVALSKWESKWHKPFLSKKELTTEETLDYIRCMTLTKNVSPEVYNHITQDNMNAVLDYISNPMTATTFGEDKTEKQKRKIVTAEVIYYWMFSYGIPYECRTWHLNQLLTLVRVFNEENKPPKKRSQMNLASDYAARNAARRKRFNTKG